MNNEVKFVVSAETRQAAAALTSFLGGLQSGLARVAGPLAALVSVGGLTALAKQSINAAEAMGKAAQLAGVAAKEFAGMAYAADRDEVDLGSLRTALKELSNEMSKTGQGSKNLKTALLEQADIFARLPDGIEKNNLAVQTFGRSGLQMIPFLNQGSAGMQAMFERGERLTGMNNELAMSADAFNDALKDLHVASQGLAGSLVSGLLPGLTRTLLAITDGIVKFREWTRESIAFEVAVKSLAVALGILATIKLGGLFVNGLGLLIGAGSIKSLKDFVAALQLVPAAATAAAASMGKFALSVVAVTEAVVAAKFWWEMWSAKALEQDEIYQTAQANEALAQSIRTRIEAERAAGKISEEQFQAMRQRLLAATALANSDEVQDALSTLSRDLAGPSGLKPRVTTDAFNAKRNEDLLRIAEQQAKNEDVIAKAKSEQTRTEFRLLTATEAIQKLEAMRKDTMRAYLDGALTRQERTEIEIKDLTQIRQIEAEILDLKVRRVMDSPGTDAEKYRKLTALGVPKEGRGTDPDDFGANVRDNIDGLLNHFGTFSQAAAAFVTNGIGSAIQGVSDGIMGLIDGTKTWAQTWGSVLKSMAAQGIQFIVQQTAMFLLNKAKELLFHTTTETTKTVATVTATKLRGQALAGEGYAAGYGAAAQAAGSVASIPYVGWAMALAAFASVMATVTTGFAAATAINAVGFAGGGYTGDGGKFEIAGPVHRGEWVMPADTVRAWGKDTMAAIQTGRIDLRRPEASQAASSEPPRVKVVIVSDYRQAMEEFMKSPFAEQVIFQTINGRRLDLGLST